MKFIKILGCLLLLLSKFAFASKALYSVTPVASSVVNVPLHFKAPVSYRVLNQTNQTQTLSFQESFELTQLVQAGSCGNPFTLGPNESCALSLWVDGNDIVDARTLQAPEVCKINSHFFCSLPDAVNLIKVNVFNYDYILVANHGASNDGSLSYCEVGPSGALENCQIFNNVNIEGAAGVAVAPGYVYLANRNLNNIVICSLDKNIAAMTCVTDDGGGIFNSPRTAYLHNNFFYTLNYGNSEVIKCDTNSNTGAISNCAATGSGFSEPLGNMLITNGYAYIPNSRSNTVSICSVSATDGTFSNCSAFFSDTFSSPSGVAVSGAYAYIVSISNAAVVACEVDASSGNLSNCFPNKVLSSTGQSGLNILSGYLYVNALSINEVTKCTLGNNGTVSDCASTGSGFVQPTGNIAFVTS
jgi:hypothetical protein